MVHQVRTGEPITFRLALHRLAQLVRYPRNPFVALRLVEQTPPEHVAHGCYLENSPSRTPELELLSVTNLLHESLPGLPASPGPPYACLRSATEKRPVLADEDIQDC